MSWMDSWSRPAKSQATPAPYYLLPGGEATPYCHSCGRVIGQRKQTQHQDKAAEKMEVKYCSSRCRGRKPGKLDREIEGVFVRFLLGKEGKEKEETKGDGDGGEAGGDGTAAEKSKRNGWNTKGSNKHQHKNTKKVKGDARTLVSCSMVEDEVFPHHRGQRNEDGSEAEEEEHNRPGSSSSHDQNEDSQQQDASSNPYQHPESDFLHDPTSYDPELHPLPSQKPHNNHEPIVDGDVLARMSSVSEVNGSVGGEKGRAERTDESEAALKKRIAGQRRAREREMVRCAARRGVAFGFVLEEEDDEGDSKAKNKGGKKNAKKAHVVEPSFAKGDWSIRWREE
ncbi:hypothetical protein PG997_010501 [Apiospora hydei]|uniref:Chitinase n=1 Tax=Apiospora hydei TaxID=1337664 RepID=A0ABR1VX63_9PEZI